jgi:signal transduction histidine kinase
VDVRKSVAATLAEVTGSTADLVVATDVPQFVRLDQRRLERTLANLLDNAERHGGGVTRVEVSTRGDFVQFAVEDAGPGVPVDERDSIFDRFHRAARRDDHATGSGLGLAIVAEHCRAHGGYVRVESGRSGGARFVAAFRSGDDR